MVQISTDNDESRILSRVIASTPGGLAPEVAREVLRWKFASVDIERMNDLAERNRQGEATPSEVNELERYSRIGNLLSLLQSEARQSLRHG